MPILLSLTQTHGREIKLEGLGDGPGFLPFKLGPMRLTTHYHTFLQYIELKEIDSNINLVRLQLTEVKRKVDNFTYAVYESQLDHLYNELNYASLQLKSLEPTRFRRGLVDSLGSVIKSITGNLDYTDAVKYNEALSVLMKNQDKIVTEQNHHISLSKDWMDEQNKIISKIVDNQVAINKTLLMLLDPDSYPQHEFIKVAKFAQILAITSNNVGSLVSEISRLENALAFCGASRTHHSMIPIDVMKNMLGKLKSLYSKDQLLELEIREYYDVIKPASFYNGDQLVFAFKFPIVSPLVYTLYRLVIVPNKNRQAVIPPFPLLALTRNIHVFIEAECPKLGTRYICEDQLNHQLKPQPECISNIIQGEMPEGKPCGMTTIILMNPAMEKLDDRHYAIVFPQPTQVRLTCEREEFNTLNGSYLATIPRDCKLRTDDFTIANVNDHIIGQPVKITKIPAQLDEVPAPYTLKVNSINLRKLHDIQDKIHHQETVRIEQPSTFYHTTIPFYGALSGALALALIVLSRKFYLRWTKKNSKIEIELTQAASTYAVPDSSQTQRKLPTIFFPNLQK